jgi:hypothetical protein
MEAKLFWKVYRLVSSVSHAPRRKREQFSDLRVVMVHLWSVLHHRPRGWACRPENWPADLGRPLISPSRLSRRLRTVGALQLLERAMAAAADLFGDPPLVKAVDSKPLTVGAYSKDADARRGRVAAGVMARGYRLHAVAHGRDAVGPRALLPMSAHDSAAAPVLFPRLAGGGYLLGDNAYDTNECRALAAAAAGHQPVAPPRACNRDVRDARHNRPERLRALDVLHGPLERCGVPSAFGRALYDGRQRVGSCFGGLTTEGLGALPSWARGPRRVALWAAGKMLLFMCGNAVKKGLMT